MHNKILNYIPIKGIRKIQKKAMPSTKNTTVHSEHAKPAMITHIHIAQLNMQELQPALKNHIITAPKYK